MKILPMAPLMEKFDEADLQANAVEVPNADLGFYKKLFLLRRPDYAPTDRQPSAVDFDIDAMWLMPGYTKDMVIAGPKYFKCVGDFNEPTGASSKDVLRALVFIKGHNKPVQVGMRGNMWVLTRPQGEYNNPKAQEANKHDTYAKKYIPLAFANVKILKVQ